MIPMREDQISSCIQGVDMNRPTTETVLLCWKSKVGLSRNYHAFFCQVKCLSIAEMVMLNEMR